MVLRKTKIKTIPFGEVFRIPKNVTMMVNGTLAIFMPRNKKKVRK